MFKKILVSLALAFCLNLSITPLASAQILNQDTRADEFAQVTAKKANLTPTDVGDIVAYSIKMVLGLLAIIFLVIIVYSGFAWMMARGNEEKVSKSLATIRMAIIGLIITLGAYAITYFVFTYLPFSGGKGTGLEGPPA